MSKHTEEPWKVEPESKDELYYIVNDNQEYIATNEHCDGAGGMKDARLIAAAPDLLAACKAALAIMAYGGEPQKYEMVDNMIRAAIAKAEGDA